MDMEKYQNKILLERRGKCKIKREKIRIYDFYCLCLTLQNDASINCLNSYQQSPLAVAAAYNHVAIIEFLLKKGAEIEIKDKDGYTPLLLAASEGKHFN